MRAIQIAHDELEAFYRRFPMGGSSTSEEEVAALSARIQTSIRPLLLNDFFRSESAALASFHNHPSWPSAVLAGILPVKDAVTEIWLKMVLAYRL